MIARTSSLHSGPGDLLVGRGATIVDQRDMPNYNHSHPKPEQQDPPAILGFGSGISFLVLSKDKATYHLAELGKYSARGGH